MSTRGMIARLAPDGSKIGTYHHFDSYPSGLGQALHRLYNREVAEGGFGKDLIYMHRVLLEEHPAGWSNITGRWGMDGPEGADFRLAPGFREYGDPANAERIWNAERTEFGPNPDYVDNPRCYCHGARSEPGSVWQCHCNEYGDSAEGCGHNFDIEYIYVLKPLGLEVWFGIHGRRGWEHRRFRLVAWDEADVTWENIDELIRAYKDAEHKLANP